VAGAILGKRVGGTGQFLEGLGAVAEVPLGCHPRWPTEGGCFFPVLPSLTLPIPLWSELEKTPSGYVPAAPAPAEDRWIRPEITVGKASAGSPPKRMAAAVAGDQSRRGGGADAPPPVVSEEPAVGGGGRRRNRRSVRTVRWRVEEVGGG
jgi:hypothetical protein